MCFFFARFSVTIHVYNTDRILKVFQSLYVVAPYIISLCKFYVVRKLRWRYFQGLVRETWCFWHFAQSCAHFFCSTAHRTSQLLKAYGFLIVFYSQNIRLWSSLLTKSNLQSWFSYKTVPFALMIRTVTVLLLQYFLEEIVALFLLISPMTCDQSVIRQGRMEGRINSPITCLIWKDNIRKVSVLLRRDIATLI